MPPHHKRLLCLALVVPSFLFCPDVEGRNLLLNGSFELGLRHGWATGGKWNVRGKALGKVIAYELPMDPKQSVDGESSVKLPFIEYKRPWSKNTHTTPGGLRRMLIPLETGTPYVFSAYVKSDAKDTAAAVTISGPSVSRAGKPLFTWDFKLTNRWQRLQLAFTPPGDEGGNEWGAKNPPLQPGGYVFGRPATAPDHYCIALDFLSGSPGSVWIDAAQLEPGEKATVFSTLNDVEVGLSTEGVAKYGNIFLVGEPLKLNLAIYNSSMETRIADLVVRIVDGDEKEVWAGNVDAGLIESGVCRKAIEPDLGRMGTFRAEVRFKGDKRLAEELVFSVLPRPREDITPEEGSLGTKLYSALDPDTWMLRMMHRAGVRWIRIMGNRPFEWRYDQPAKDKWVWRDDAITRIRDNGFAILPCIRLRGEAVPKWAHTGMPENMFPVRDEDVSRYIEAIVGHYKPWIKHWEILNEPDKSDPERALHVLKLGRASAKRADPEAVIVGPCANAPRYVEPWIKGGGLELIDIFSYHYVGSGRTDEEILKRCEQAIDYSRRDGKKRTLWNTEENNRAMSFPFYRRFHEVYPNNIVKTYTRPAATSKVYLKARRAAAGLARMYILSRARGTAKTFYWCFYNSPRMVPSVLHFRPFEYDGALAPRGAALSIAANFLDGAGPAGEVAITPDSTAYLFERQGDTIAVFWRTPEVAETTVRLEKPEGMNVLDMMANPVEGNVLAVGEAPLYVVGKGMSGREITELLAALRTEGR